MNQLKNSACSSRNGEHAPSDLKLTTGISIAQNAPAGYRLSGGFLPSYFVDICATMTGIISCSKAAVTALSVSNHFQGVIAMSILFPYLLKIHSNFFASPSLMGGQ